MEVFHNDSFVIKLVSLTLTPFFNFFEIVLCRRIRIAKCIYDKHHDMQFKHD